MPVEELTSELREFRLEVKEGLAKLDTQLKELLRNRGNEQQLATILAAVRASAPRQGAAGRRARTTAQLSMSRAPSRRARGATKNYWQRSRPGPGATRNSSPRAVGERRIDGIKEDVGALDQKVSAIGTSMVKKTRKESARDLKRTNLVNHEVVLDRVEAEPVACGSQGVVYQGEYMGDAVALKKISLASLTVIKRQQMISQFAEELSIMMRLRSPRTVAVLGVVTTDESFLGLVMEFMPGGSIRQRLDDG